MKKRNCYYLISSIVFLGLITFVGVGCYDSDPARNEISKTVVGDDPDNTPAEAPDLVLCDVTTEFTCDDGGCIADVYRCDQVNDCADGSDEVCALTDMENGTILDNITGLIWLKDANAFGLMSWDDATEAVQLLNSGELGLTDGSEEGDWRLPTVEEWEAFVNTAYKTPALANTAGDGQWTEGDAFVNVQLDKGYWSSTLDDDDDSDNVWGVEVNSGSVASGSKLYNLYVWPIRSGD